MVGGRYSLLGVGIYSPAEAARILRVAGEGLESLTSQKLRRWARGYWHPSGDESRFSSPVIRPELEGACAIEAVSFRDLLELGFIATFRAQGVSMPTIRAAARRGAELFGTDHPFTVKSFRTDGRDIFAELEHDDSLEPGRRRQVLQEAITGQSVFAEFIEPFLKKIEFGPSDARLFHPLGEAHPVVLDPQRSFGRPLIDSAGVGTYALYMASEGGNSAEDIARWYDVAISDVRAALEFEGALKAA